MTRFLSPFGIDLFCTGKKYLVLNIVSRNIKIKYRRSFLGVFWTILSPLATAATYYLVFKMILNVRIPHYLAFIMSGVIPWAFFSQTVLEGMESLVGSIGLVSKVPIPVQVFPYTGAITNLITFCIATPVLIGASLVSNVPLSSSILILPFYIGLLFFMAYGLGLVLSLLYVYFRDLRHLLGLVLQLWLYATPVIYDDSMVPPKFHWILYANPVGTIISDLHSILAKGTWPSANHILVSSGWTVLVLLLGLLTHHKLSVGIVERL